MEYVVVVVVVVVVGFVGTGVGFFVVTDMGGVFGSVGIVGVVDVLVL